MTSGQRIAVLVIAAVILVGGFVIAQGSGDDDESDRASTTTSPPAQTQAETAPAEPQNPAATTPVETTEAPPPAPRVETVRISDGGPAGEARTIEYESGDTVRLRFESDAAAEVHIHGYDKYVNVPAEGSARTRFKADAEGVFEVEEHHSGELLAKLEVRP